MGNILLLLLSIVIHKACLDTSPQFTLTTPTSVAIPEGPAGRSIFNVTATLNPTEAVTFSLERQEPTTPALFNITVNGSIMTTKEIDYETIPVVRFVLKIKAVSSTNPAATANTTINVNITDVNDNTPTFASKSLCGAVSSNASLGTIVGTYRATDNDTTSNNKVSQYEITGGDELQAKFKIDAATGVITTTGEVFHKAVKPTYILAITASDGKNTGKANVTVTLDGNCTNQQQNNNNGGGNSNGSDNNNGSGNNNKAFENTANILGLVAVLTVFFHVYEEAF